MSTIFASINSARFALLMLFTFFHLLFLYADPPPPLCLKLRAWGPPGPLRRWAGRHGWLLLYAPDVYHNSINHTGMYVEHIQFLTSKQNKYQLKGKLYWKPWLFSHLRTYMNHEYLTKNMIFLSCILVDINVNFPQCFATRIRFMKRIRIRRNKKVTKRICITDFMIATKKPFSINGFYCKNHYKKWNLFFSGSLNGVINPWWSSWWSPGPRPATTCHLTISSCLLNPQSLPRIPNLNRQVQTI